MKRQSIYAYKYEYVQAIEIFMFLNLLTTQKSLNQSWSLNLNQINIPLNMNQKIHRTKRES